MAVFPRPSSPRVFWADLRAFLGSGHRHRLLFGGLAVGITVMILVGFYIDSQTDPPKPQIIYVQSWPASRTDAEIVRQNIADQKILDARREKKRQEYQRLAQQLGIE